MSERLESNVTQYLIDPEIRGAVGAHLRGWMFQKDINRAFADVILRKEFNGLTLDQSVVKMAMEAGPKKFQDGDWSYIDNLFDTSYELLDENRVIVLNIISEFIRERLFWKGTDFLAKNRLEKAEPILAKAVNFSLTTSSYTNLADQIKLKSLFENKFPKDGKYIKSTLSLVNTNALFKGYRRTDLIQICARPKAGKTTLMTQESAAFSSQGYHVVFASIGDNEEDDIAMKICSYASKTPVNEVIENFEEIIENNAKILKNVDAKSYPSSSVAVGELLADCKAEHNKRPIDILVIDYDANIMQTGDSMYESGGIIYSALKGFGQVNNCVVIVGSQPVKSAWNDEILQADAANESSKKQHHVDMQITIGVNSECPTIGTINIPLMRRGTGNVITRVKFNFDVAEIREICQEDYNEILANKKTTSATLQLDGMMKDDIENY